MSDNKQKKVLDRLGIILVIVVPLLLITFTYIFSYTSSLKVSFDDVITEDSIYIKNYITIDEVDAISLTIDWKTLSSPKKVEDVLSNGFYTFELSYESNDNYQVNQVSITPVLQTKWADIRSVGETINLSENMVTQSKIDFNFELPMKPLYFINVEEPILYLKISFVNSINNLNVPYTIYVKYELTDIYPSQVI
jgi:hypothetical protein